jgi:hypothetical protein
VSQPGNEITSDVTVTALTSGCMSGKALETKTEDLDRQVARSATALRVLAYAMFVGAIAMGVANQLGEGPINDIFTGGDARVSLQIRITQFVTSVIPYLALAAVVLAISVLIQIAMERVRVIRQVSFPAPNDSGPARRMAVDDDLWRQPSAAVEGD